MYNYNIGKLCMGLPHIANCAMYLTSSKPYKTKGIICAMSFTLSTLFNISNIDTENQVVQ